MDRPNHTSDGQCDLDRETFVCRECGAYHGDPCSECGGRGFHQGLCRFHEDADEPADEQEEHVCDESRSTGRCDCAVRS